MLNKIVLALLLASLAALSLPSEAGAYGAAYVRGPYGGAAAVRGGYGYGGAAAYRGPYGGAAYRGPSGGYAYVR